ncbi:MAG: penicillin acylase family protein [Truepera sp.]|nr:penicillin acylase family protein [Truepera sp.]
MAGDGSGKRRGLRLWWFGAGFGGLLVLAILVTGAYFRLSLPSYDGSVTVAGLDAPVEIVRDSHAIPHIYARSLRDGAFAMGFAHAQDRLWQMEMQRRIGAARISEVFGDRSLETDRFLRTLGLYRIAERNFARLSPRAQAIYQAYAAGVNAYLESRSGPLPPEFLLLGHEPEPWRPADSLVWLKMMAWDLGDNFQDELLRARLAKRLDPEQLQDLWPPYLGEVPPPADDRPAFDPVDIDFEALAASVPKQPVAGLGSNNWVLSGAHTESGKPLLANDPHLGLSIPSIWYLAHISTPDFEIVGATLPGLPLPVLGQTRDFAWGFTNTRSDVQDLFIERIDPDDPARYLTPEGSLPFEVRTETIEVSGGDAVELTVRGTRHGPVVSDLIGASESFLEAGHVLAFAWTALAEDDRTAEALVGIASAKDWDSFVTALRDLAVPQQNIVFADRLGNIGYIAPGRIPIRASGQGQMPSPGWTGTHDWVGRVPFAALPRSYNPAGGRIVTANNRVVGPDYPFFLTDDWAPPYRAWRIETLLDTEPVHSVASFTAMQQDVVSLAAARLLPVLLEVTVPGGEAARRATGLLERWDHRMDRGRTEPLIYIAWLRALMRGLLADELGPIFEDYWKIRIEVLHRVLTERTAWCDVVTTDEPESCATVAGAALEVALQDLTDRYGEDMTDWRWGEAHVAWMKNQVLGEIPVIGAWFEVKLPSGGEAETVKAGGFTVSDPDHPFAQIHGAGYRAVYDLAEPERSVFIQSSGQSGNPFSPHYRDFAEAWRDGRYLPMLPERTHLDQGALGTLILRPR